MSEDTVKANLSAAEGKTLPVPSEADLKVLRAIHAKTEGKSWEPPDPRHPFILRMLDAGLLVRRDGRFMFERFKDSHLAFTEAGIRLATEGQENAPAPGPKGP